MSVSIKTLLAAVMLAVIVIMVCGCGGNPAEQSPESGRVAPDFQLMSLEGKTVSLSDFKGKPVLLNFWATWCGPCRGEMPFLQEVSEDADLATQGLIVLTVNLGESKSLAQKFMDDNDLDMSVLLDTTQKVGTLYNIQYIPTTYFIDKDGKINDMKVGAFISKAEITHSLLDSIIQSD